MKEIIMKYAAAVMLLAIAPTILVLYANFLNVQPESSFDQQTYVVSGSTHTLLVHAGTTLTGYLSGKTDPFTINVNYGELTYTGEFKLYNRPSPITINKSSYYLVIIAKRSGQNAHNMKLYYWNGTTWVEEFVASVYNTGNTMAYIYNISGMYAHYDGENLTVTPPASSTPPNLGVALVTVMTIAIAAAAITKLE